MITIKGIFKGIKNSSYDFKNQQGNAVVGTTYNAYIEEQEDNLSPDVATKAIKLPSLDYKVLAKKGDLVEWVVDINKSGKLILISESVKK